MMRRRRIISGACGVALLSLALAGPMAGRAAAQSRTTPWLGVTTQDITSDLREGLDYQGSGVIVNRVVEDSPADKAGIRNGDVIVSVDSRIIDTASELVEVVHGARVGQTVALSIVRDGARRSISARLADRPDDMEDQMDESSPDEPVAPRTPMAPRAPRAPRAPSAPGARVFEWNGGDFDMQDLQDMSVLRGLGRGRLGVQIQDINEDLGDALGVTGGKGVLVTDVIKDTPASRAGMKAGDVITRVGDRTVEDVDGLRQALRGQEGRVSVTVLRKGARRTIDAELVAEQDVRRQVIRIPDIRARVLRDHAKTLRDDEGSEVGRTDLERQMEDLRQQLRDMRRKLDAMNKK